MEMTKIILDAPVFDMSREYYIGDMVTYDGVLYALEPSGFYDVIHHKRLNKKFANSYEYDAVYNSMVDKCPMPTPGVNDENYRAWGD